MVAYGCDLHYLHTYIVSVLLLKIVIRNHKGSEVSYFKAQTNITISRVKFHEHRPFAQISFDSNINRPMVSVWL